MKKLQLLCLQISVFILFFPLFQTSLFSQSSIDYKWYLNANAGFSQCYGDVQDESNPLGKFQDETSYGFGLRLGRYVSPVFAIHAQFLSTNLKGQKTPNDISYSSDFIESQLGFSMNLINLFSREKRNRRVNIYAISGIGMIFFRSELFQVSTGNLMNNYGDKDTWETTFVVPLGGGLDFKLSDRWYANLESVIRFTGSDKLDAVEAGSKNDAIFYTSMGLTYHFGRKKEKSVKEPEKVIGEIPDAIPDDFVKVEYILPEEIISGREFDMKCIISKGEIDGKAELTQVLPIGLIVKDTMIGGARTEFKNYTLHLYWDEIPSDSVFEINYTVLPKKVFGTFPFTSILYLDKTGKEYKFKSSVRVIKQEMEENLHQQELVVSDPEQIKAVEEKTRPPAISSNKIEFKVQVRASRQAIEPIQRLAEKYHITDDINEDFIGNWYRYSIGSFSTYNDVKEFRNLLIAENGIRDAFIVAFVNGKRLNDLSDLKVVAPEAYPNTNTSFNKNGMLYRIQILAVKHNKVDIESLKNVYGLQQEVNEEVFHNWRKYTVGRFLSFKEAAELKNILVEKGISDAFVVIYQNGQRITINKRVN